MNNNDKTVDLKRRVVSNALWVTPVLTAVALPAHAQMSPVTDPLTLADQSTSLNVGDTESILSQLQGGIVGGTGPFTLCYEDPQNPGTYVTTGILDFGDWTYDIDNDVVTGVVANPAGEMPVRVKDSTGASADAVVTVEIIATITSYESSDAIEAGGRVCKNALAADPDAVAHDYLNGINIMVTTIDGGTSGTVDLLIGTGQYPASTTLSNNMFSVVVPISYIRNPGSFNYSLDMTVTGTISGGVITGDRAISNWSDSGACASPSPAVQGFAMTTYSAAVA